MTKELVSTFVSDVIKHPPPQVVEDVASESHETRRLPDPHVFLIDEGFLKTPSGDPVEDYMEKESHLGQLEFIAFDKIQKWANKEDYGTAVWFSPPHPEAYPVSKIIISEITESEHGVKSLFSRAMVLDINADRLIGLANQLQSDHELIDSEMLRGVPYFPSEEQYSQWFDNLSYVTPQHDLASSGEDILLKQETYTTISSVHALVPAGEAGVNYSQLYDESRQKGLIGNHQGSCPTILKTPFETVFGNSQTITESKTLECTCPFCDKKVTASIGGGKIHCPECNKSTPYNC